MPSEVQYRGIDLDLLTGNVAPPKGDKAGRTIVTSEPEAPVFTALADTPALDAFSRLRVSNPVTVFDNTQQYGDNPLIWETKNTGSGATTNLFAESTVLLSTGGVLLGARSVRETCCRHRYQPGHGHMILLTFALTLKANVRSRVGQFDDQVRSITEALRCRRAATE